MNRDRVQAEKNSTVATGKKKVADTAVAVAIFKRYGTSGESARLLLS